MNTSPLFERRILGTFGDVGRLWLDRLGETVARYTRQFGLRDLEPVDVPSYGWVAFCSRGDESCVLKLSVPNPEAVTEVSALEHFSPSVACRVLADDRSCGVVLLERLLPGTPLRRTELLEARIHAASGVFGALHGDDGEDRLAARMAGSGVAGATFPRYFDQARRAYRKTETWLSDAHRDPASIRSIAEMLRAGRGALERLECATAGASRPDRLLHGDLHHDNILRAADGWKLIDPKGILGPLCLEPARFILNQIEEAPIAESDAEFRRMCQAFAAVQHVTRKSVAIATVLDATVTTCWSIEEDGDPSQISEAVERALRIAAWAEVG